MRTCDHCGTGFTPRAVEERYCCRGCEFVAAMIREQGFGRYYELKSDAAASPVRSRPFENHDFSWISPAAGMAEKVRRPGGAA